MELERSVERFKSEGLGVAAISYDSPEILAHFSNRMGGFHYPLLADPQSSIIRAFGVLNRNVEKGHPSSAWRDPSRSSSTPTAS